MREEGRAPDESRCRRLSSPPDASGASSLALLGVVGLQGEASERRVWELVRGRYLDSEERRLEGERGPERERRRKVGEGGRGWRGGRDGGRVHRVEAW